MKITKAQVKELIKLYTSKQQTVSELAERYGVTKPAINFRLRQAGIKSRRAYKRRTWKGRKKTDNLKPTTVQALPATPKEGLEIKLSERDREALIHHLHQFIELPNEPLEVGGCDDSFSLTAVWLKHWWYPRRKRRKRLQQIEAMDTYHGKCDCELYTALIKGRRRLFHQ